MSGSFIDSSVFVYSLDPSNREKREIARRLIGDVLHNGEGSISFQVIQETLNVITRKFQQPVVRVDLEEFLDEVLVPMWRVMPSRRLYERALDLQSRYGKSFYDSLIVSAALEAGCTRLYSDDLRHGQRIEGLVIENPFL